MSRVSKADPGWSSRGDGASAGASLGLRELRYFTVLCEELHFGRAAERLHISQPPLSQALAQLERKLGTRLLDRTTRNVTLTPAGEVLREHARRLLREADDAVGATQRAAAGEVGTLRVAVTPGVRHTVLPAVRHELAIRFPELGVDVVEELGDAVYDRLRRGAADIGIAVCAEDDSVIASKPFRRDQPVAVMRRDHPLATRPRVTIAQLGKHPLLLWPRRQSRGSYDLVLSIFDGRSAAAVIEIEMFAGGWWSETASGGFAVIPAGAAVTPEFVTVPISDAKVHFTISLVWSVRTPPAILPAAVDAVDELSAAQGWL